MDQQKTYRNSPRSFRKNWKFCLMQFGAHTNSDMVKDHLTMGLMPLKIGTQNYIHTIWSSGKPTRTRYEVSRKIKICSKLTLPKTSWKPTTAGVWGLHHWQTTRFTFKVSLSIFSSEYTHNSNKISDRLLTHFEPFTGSCLSDNWYSRWMPNLSVMSWILQRLHDGR